MNLTFISNYYNHHQEVLCQELYKEYVNEFKFLEFGEISQERLKLGYKHMTNSFVVSAIKDPELADKIINNTDIFVLGNANYELRKRIVKTNKPVFLYSERFLKSKLSYFTIPLRIIRNRILDRENIFLLAASAYAKNDYKKTLVEFDDSLKWGYFTRYEDINNINEFINKKEKKRLVWVGRLIKYKRPGYALDLAKHLDNLSIDFELVIIGEGPLKSNLIRKCKELNLEDKIKIVGSLTNNQVMEYLNESSILLATSDRGEGWGAVINEGMATANVVVASVEMGATKFLIKDGVNGYSFSTLKELKDIVVRLLTSESNHGTMYEAYKTISCLWNGEVAARRLINYINFKFNDNSIFSSYYENFEDGPISNIE